MLRGPCREAMSARASQHRRYHPTSRRRRGGFYVLLADDPSREKRAAAAARAALPPSRHLTYTFERCRSTVRALTTSRAAISSLLSPSATSASTCISRSLSSAAAG